MTVNALKSQHTVIPYDYYLPHFGFCEPEGGEPKSASSNFGSVLFGDRVFDSPFELKMNVNESCKILCPLKTLEPAQVNFLIQRIQERYMMNWAVDGLPVGRKVKDNTTEYSTPGFELGTRENKKKVNSPS